MDKKHIKLLNSILQDMTTIIKEREYFFVEDMLSVEEDKMINSMLDTRMRIMAVISKNKQKEQRS